MGSDSERTGAAWEERIQWILERYEDGSRRAMGRKVGLSGQAISAWARGETKPSGEGLAAIIRTYPEIRARWLLTGNGAPRIAAADPARLVETGALSEGRGSAAGGDGGADPEREGSAALERAYEAGRRDAVMEMMKMLGEITNIP
ncbi:MAG: hypothetical protein Q8W44_00905 [Candidatus Palauibacterales bacterium]|nr:hypothetical protein [Candidatus Palauibacterales bacterium]